MKNAFKFSLSLISRTEFSSVCKFSRKTATILSGEKKKKLFLSERSLKIRKKVFSTF